MSQISLYGKKERLTVLKSKMILQNLLAEEIANEKQQIISNTLQLLSNNNKFDKNKFWKLKKKIFPKMSQSKMSVIDDKGTDWLTLNR